MQEYFMDDNLRACIKAALSKSQYLDSYGIGYLNDMLKLAVPWSAKQIEKVNTTLSEHARDKARNRIRSGASDHKKIGVQRLGAKPKRHYARPARMSRDPVKRSLKPDNLDDGQPFNFSTLDVPPRLVTAASIWVQFDFDLGRTEPLTDPASLARLVVIAKGLIATDNLMNHEQGPLATATASPTSLSRWAFFCVVAAEGAMPTRPRRKLGGIT
jgi:hypothetical protein